MSLTSGTYLFINQLGLLREVEASDGNVDAFILVPANGYHNGQALPEDVVEELNSGGFDKTTVDGLDYFKVPEDASNQGVTVSRYANDPEGSFYAEKTGEGDDSHYGALGAAELTEASSDEADASEETPAPKKKKSKKEEEPAAEESSDSEE